MKKVLILLSVMALVFTFSFGVMAGDYSDIIDEIMADYNGHEIDGVEAWFNSASSNISSDSMNRSGAYKDADNDNHPQSASATVAAEAYIPCYLELTVTGNDGQYKVESYGPDAHASITGPAHGGWRYHMTFDNEYGGFVNDEWNAIGHGRNVEVKPGDDIYIQACDLFRVNMYSNDDYTYEVTSAPLQPANAAIAATALPVGIRTFNEDGTLFGTDVFDVSKTITINEEIPACTEMEYLHQFRVPYNRDIRHGSYTGSVTFRVATI